MLLDIFITLVLVFLNGFFVAAEFAMVKVRSSQLELKAHTGDKRAVLSLSIINNLNAYLSATQLGITLASLGLGWIGETVVASMMVDVLHFMKISQDPALVHSIAIAVAFASITVLHIVFGELAPKSLALFKPESVTLAVAYPMRFFYLVFRPAIWLLNGFANNVIKLIGFTPSEHAELHSAEELQLLLEHGRDTGAIEATEHELIQNVFGFNRITARQVMVPRTSINALDIESTPDELMTKIIQEGYSRMPVYKDNLDNIVGVVYTKDLVKMIHQKQELSLEKAMRAPFFIPETKKISELLKELQERHQHMAVVTDEFGGVAGIVTIEDIIEELVGEIQDEHDDEVPVVEKINEKEFLVNALASIDDINEYLPYPLKKDSDYDTLAGMVIHQSGRIPELNNRIKLGRYEVQILKKTKQTILGVKLMLT